MFKTRVLVHNLCYTPLAYMSVTRIFIAAYGYPVWHRFGSHRMLPEAPERYYGLGISLKNTLIDSNQVMT